MDKHELAWYALKVANGHVKCAILRRLNQMVLVDDTSFYHSPGGSKLHHNYRHGLVIHVNEVMQNVFAMTRDNPGDELITAVIWHDYMKTRDYKLDGETVLETPYRKHIRHLAGSAMEFHACAAPLVAREKLECIEHLLLSHHGRREWGSPVEPETADAHILHAADRMSAEGVNIEPK